MTQTDTCPFAELGAAQPRVRATAFGLDIEADIPLSLLHGATAAPTGRSLRISGGREPLPLAPAATASSAPDQPPILERRPPVAPARSQPATFCWPDSAEVVCDQREPDGTIAFRIEAHPQAGYLIWGPAYGSHHLALDGAHARCLPGDAEEAAQQRLLIAQVLPFAALLHGYEVFHASAIVWDGRAIGIVGPSRAGKTSVALELCRRGAAFLADDVLVLERSGEQLLAHPGTPIAGLAHQEARRLQQLGRATPEIVAANERERLVRIQGAARPAPLARLFFLDRRASGPREPQFEPSAEPRLLLGSTFNSVLTGPQRLQRLLEVCALAADLPVERIVSGPATDATQVGAAIEHRLGSPRADLAGGAT
jgi:hypothetical protein